MEPVPSGTDRSRQLTHQQSGRDAEQRARLWLERAGLCFIAANVCYRVGELDLIMRDKHIWVFVEVRYRRDNSFGGALSSVTLGKQKKLLQAAALWLCQRGACFSTTDCRFDIVAITGTDVEWLKNAFTAQ
ncbi:MAG: hypothetical protein XXXJIFNMEKO3_02533 [Candidatus Erwinia impunctatus]|nr:hypothetical protein XXXJIFNMEKO_02533 [Culicoides impunctatus]